MRWVLPFLTTLMLAACSGLPFNTQPPRVAVASLDVRSFGIFEQKLDLGLRVANPNAFDIKVEALDFTLEVNGAPLATGLSRTSTLLPATSTTLMRVEAYVPSRAAVELIRRISPEQLRDGVPYRIHGRIKLEGLDWLPFEKHGRYGEAGKPAGLRI